MCLSMTIPCYRFALRFLILASFWHKSTINICLCDATLLFIFILKSVWSVKMPVYNSSVKMYNWSVVFSFVKFCLPPPQFDYIDLKDCILQCCLLCAPLESVMVSCWVVGCMASFMKAGILNTFSFKLLFSQTW